MSLRVAYDISIIAKYYYRYGFETFGVFRVADEILRAMRSVETIQLIPVRLCQELSGPDPVYASMNYWTYVEDHPDRVSAYEDPFSSRLGLTQTYRQVYQHCFSEAFQTAPVLSASSIYFRTVRKLLASLQFLDLYRSLDTSRFDLFHSTYFQFPPRALTGNLPRLLTIYDLIPLTAPELVMPELTATYQALLAEIDRQRDWILCISEHARQEFCQYTGMAPERVFVCPLAAAAHFHPVTDPQAIATTCRQYGINPEVPYFLGLSTLQPRKNFLHLVRTFHQLLQTHPALDVNLVLVGKKGWLCEDVFAEIEQSPLLRSRVLFPGYIPDADISQIYSGARAFIYPSLYEGFGLPPLEAMQCGTPVITSNTTSLPEVVGDAGILVDPRDGDALATAMLQLLQDGVLQQRLRQQSLTRARSFSWVQSATRVAEIYQTIVEAEKAG